MSSIYKAYDVRGLYPQELNPDTAQDIGEKCAKILDSGTILIARDGRHGSPELANAFMEGLQKGAGRFGKTYTIENVGLSTSPMFYFLVNHRHASGGVMVTASHNPKEYNGLKVMRPGGNGAVSGEEIQAIQL